MGVRRLLPCAPNTEITLPWLLALMFLLTALHLRSVVHLHALDDHGALCAPVATNLSLQVTHNRWDVTQENGSVVDIQEAFLLADGIDEASAVRAVNDPTEVWSAHACGLVVKLSVCLCELLDVTLVIVHSALQPSLSESIRLRHRFRCYASIPSRSDQETCKPAWRFRGGQRLFVRVADTRCLASWPQRFRRHIFRFTPKIHLDRPYGGCHRDAKPVS